MITKTDDIKLPPRDHVVAILGDQAIGYVQTWNEKSMREYGAACARAAVEADRREYLDTLKLARAIVNGHRRDNPPEDSVEADRQGRMPSDDERGTSDPIAGLPRAQSVSDEMMDLVDRLGSEYDEVDPRAWEHLLVYAPRLSRYGSSQPAAEAVLRKILQVVQRYLPPDGIDAHQAMGEIIALVDPWPLSGQPAASAEVAHGLLQQFFDALDDALSKERASPWTGLKGEKFRDRMLAWDRVKKLRGQLLAAPVAQGPVDIEELAFDCGGTLASDGRFSFSCVAWHKFRKAAAPVAAQSSAVDAALRTLESACDALCSLRTREQYLSMIDGGQKDALQALDDARSKARRVLSSPVAARAQPWQALAAAIYQAAGAYDMPVRILDALSAAANGEQFAHLIDGLLPVESPVAQEPVAYLACNPETGEPVWSEGCICKDNVYSMEDTGTIGRPVFFAPVAAQARPVVNQQMTIGVDQSFVNLTPETAAYTTAQPSAQGETVYRSADILKAFNNGFDMGLRQRTSQDRKNDETLADTQRQIIEAAEQRGYARAKAECERGSESQIPAGWVFFAADFSMYQRTGQGSVMLMRDKAGTDAWHKLTEEMQETTDLYATGDGATLREAIEVAARAAREADHD